MNRNQNILVGPSGSQKSAVFSLNAGEYVKNQACVSVAMQLFIYFCILSKACFEIFLSQVPEQQSDLVAGDGLLHQPVQQSAGSAAQPQPSVHHPSQDLPAAKPPASVSFFFFLALSQKCHNQGFSDSLSTLFPQLHTSLEDTQKKLQDTQEIKAHKVI